jgi:selenide,water dikinase
MISEEVGELIELGCIPEGTRENLNTATVVVDWARLNDHRRTLLTDAQTSGGLLLCVRDVDLTDVLRILRKARTPVATLIGKIVKRRQGRPLICMTS